MAADFVLEACVDSLDSALAAKEGGATRLELCANLLIGGTTPMPSLVRRVKAATGLPTHALLRPRFGDFLYTGEEFSLLLEDAAALLEAGADAIVSGFLTPEGDLDRQRLAQLVELCREHIAPAAAAHGITCCVEPLNQKETNILTTSGECFRLVEAVNHPNLQLLVDLYHFDLEGESLSALEGYRGRLGHCHIASAQNSRLVPQPWDGQDYLPFFQALAAMGYEGRLSLEGDTRGGLPQIRSSLAYLRQLIGQAAQ